MQKLDNISINFILSTARTGSTLLSSMLNMHPNIISAIEEPFAYNLFQRYKHITKWSDATIEKYCDDFYLYSSEKLELQFGNKNDLITLLKKNKNILSTTNVIKLSYLIFQPQKPKESITTIIDKQLHFHFHLKELCEFYPKAKFIILIRDPRDNTLLKRKYLLKKGNSKDIYILSKQWNYIFESILYKLKDIDSSRILKIKYEDLVLSPEIELKKIYSFLNLEYDSTSLNFHKVIASEFNTRVNNLDISKQIFYYHTHYSLTEKVNTKKINIWKKELSNKESDLVWSICGNTALKYNYEADGSKKIFYSDFSHFNFYKIYILKNFLIQRIYKLMPLRIKHFIKIIFRKKE